MDRRKNKTKKSSAANQKDPRNSALPVDTEKSKLDSNQITADRERPPHNATPIDKEESKIDFNPATADQLSPLDSTTPVEKEELKMDITPPTADPIDPPHSYVTTKESEHDSMLAIADQTIIDSTTAAQEDPLDNTTPVDREESKIDTNQVTGDQIDPQHSAAPVDMEESKIDSNSATGDQKDPPHNITTMDKEESKIDSNPATANQIDPPHSASSVDTEESEISSNLADQTNIDSYSATADQTKIDSNPTTADQEDPLYSATPVDREESKIDTNQVTGDQIDLKHSANPVDTEEPKIDTNQVTGDQIDPQHSAAPVDMEESKIDSNSATGNQKDPPHNVTTMDKEESKIDSNPATANQIDPPHSASSVDTEESEISSNLADQTNIDSYSATADQTKIDSNPTTADQKDPLYSATPVDREESKIDTNQVTGDQIDLKHSATPVDTEEPKIDTNQVTGDQIDPQHSVAPVDMEESKIDFNQVTGDQIDLKHSATPVNTEEPKIDSITATGDQKDPQHSGAPVDTEESKIDSNPATGDQKDPPHNATIVDREESNIDSNPATANKMDPPHNATPVDTEESEISSNLADQTNIDSNSTTADQTKIDSVQTIAGQEDPLDNATPVNTKQVTGDRIYLKHIATPVDTEESKIDSNPATANKMDPPHNATPVDLEESEIGSILADQTKIDSNSTTADKTKIDSNPTIDDPEDPLHNATPVDREESEIDTNPVTSDLINLQNSATPVDTEESKIDSDPATDDQSKIDSNQTTANQDNPLPSAPVDTKLETDDQNDDLQSSTVDLKESLQNGTPFDRDEYKMNSKTATVNQKYALQSATPVYTKTATDGQKSSPTVDQKEPLQHKTPSDKDKSLGDSESATVNKKQSLRIVTPIDTKTVKAIKKIPSNSIQSPTCIQKETQQKKALVNTDKERIDQIKSQKYEILNGRKLLKPRQKPLRNKTYVIKDKSVHGTEPNVAIKEPEENPRTSDIEMEAIESLQLVKDVQKDPNRNSTMEVENSKLDNLQEVIKTTQDKSIIFVADTNKLMQKLETGEVISLLDIIVPMSPNLSTTIENLIRQEKNNATQVHFTSSIQKLQCHSHVTPALINQNESGVEREVIKKEEIVVQAESAIVDQKRDIESKIYDKKAQFEGATATTDDQTVSNTSSAAVVKKKENVYHTKPVTVNQNEETMVREGGKKRANQMVDDIESVTASKCEEKESLENTFLDKNETVVLTESAMIIHNKLSAHHIDSEAFDENTESGQDTKKIPGIIDSDTGSHKLQREFTSREEDLALEDMMSLLWPNFSTTATESLIDLIKNNDAQISPVCSTSKLEKQQVNKDVTQAPINKDKSGLEKQPETKDDSLVDGTETTKIDKKDACCNMVETSGKKEENGIHAKSVTVNKKRDAESKIINVKDGLERKTGTTANRTGADKKQEIVGQTVTVNQKEETSGTKVDQPVDGTDLTTVDKKGEIIETNSCLPFMVNSCRLTFDKKTADEKEVDFYDLQTWCTITSSNASTCLKEQHTDLISTQTQIHKNEYCRSPNSQATNNEKLDDPLYETLRFHSVHGKNIVLSCSNFMAQREKAANFLSQGIAFSCRPVRINEKVCLRMENLSDYKYGVITFGFTNIDPKTLIGNLPDSAITDLAKLPGFWAYRLEKSWCEKNNILNYQVNKSGNVVYGINNVEKGALYWGIDTSKPVWGFINIIGYFTALKFTSIKEYKKPSIIAPLPRLKYQIQFQPLVPSKLHVLEGDNIDFLGFKGVVAKSDNSFNKGYIFSKHSIRPGQTIVVQILSTGPESEFLPLGLTICDPATLTLIDLPDDAGNLTDNSEYWLVYKNVSNCLENGDELAITMTRKGEIQLTRNDNEPVTVKQVKKSEKYWAFVQIYGTIETVRMWSTVRGPPRVRYSVK